MSRTMVKQVFFRGGKKFFRDNLFLSTIWGNSSTVCLSKSEVISKCSKRDDLGQTTIILQDGLDIQELPTIVRKVKGVGVVPLDNKSYINSETSANVDEDKYSSHNFTKFEDIEANEIIEGFKRCFTTKGVFLLLNTIPDEEVTPPVALHAIKKIIELENNQQYRNMLVKGGEDMPENFTRTAIFNQLIDTILSGSDSGIILDSLKVVSREMSPTNSAYRDKLCDEILIRVTEGKFNVKEMCEIIKIMASFMDVKQSLENVDKLWVGLVDKEKEISEKNIMEVFRIVPLLKQSRKVVFSLLERRTAYAWWRLSGNSVAEILSILLEIKLFSSKIVGILSRWTNTNIHLVNEDDLLEIVTGFCALDYVDGEITKALERYVKAKSSKVKNAAVLASIADYCGKFRIRSEPIFSGCENYFIEHGQHLSPIIMKSMFIPFGILDIRPSNSIKFWQTIESILDEKFVQFRPDDAIDVMLTCVYLEKYPLNFVKKIFNPYFLDRLHSYSDINLLRHMRSKLKLFDTSMTLECSQYRGPMLPKDHSAKTIWQDGRVRRMANYISEPLADILGGSDKFTPFVILPHLPMLSLYVIDIMLHPSGMGGSTIQFNLRRDRNIYVAVLIHVPEHYCSSGSILLGPQVMRKRHFRRLGMKVVELQYSKLAKLRMHPKPLKDYLIERLKMAEDAL